MSGENTGSIGRAKRLDGIDNRSLIRLKLCEGFPDPGAYFDTLKEYKSSRRSTQTKL